MRIVVLIAIFAAVGLASGAQRPADSAGTRLEQHSWVTAEKVLTPDTVVVIPLGAALKEHGPHLKLRNDLALAEYFTERVISRSPVVVTAPLTYHFYPAFLEYPGSTSLSLETARDYTLQIVRNLAQHGPRRFYVLNTGISTIRALEPVAAQLAQEGILLAYTNFGEALDRAAGGVRQQEGGSHADEVETSMMLYIDPSSVDMSLAVKDFAPRSTPMRLRRQKAVPGTYSPSGVWGDPTLATREKGQVIVEALVKTMLDDIETVRTTALPVSSQSGPAAAPAQLPARAPQEVRLPNGCTPGDERSIRRIEMAFNLAWRRVDAEAVAALWADEGDIVHADGFTERGRQTIQQNRSEQFRRREFRGSRHVLAFGSVRCINPRVAVVDSRWELSGVLDLSGNTVPNADGLSTLVVQRSGDQWLIEAYRYNVKPGAPAPPRLLARPGYPDKG